MSGFELELEFYQRTDAEDRERALQAARRTPRCPECAHHPNAHANGACGVIQERANGKSKCGCTAVRRRVA